MIAVYSDHLNDYLLELDIKYVSLFVYTVKGVLFVWMRYAEVYPSSKLNDFQTCFIYVVCGTFHPDRVPNDHFLRNLLRHH